jgi:hypothetical protein
LFLASIPQVPAEEVELARFKDYTLSQKDLLAIIESRGGFYGARYRDPAEAKRLVDEVVTNELLARAARDRALDKQPDVRSAINTLLVQKLLTWETIAERGCGGIGQGDLDGDQVPPCAQMDGLSCHLGKACLSAKNQTHAHDEDHSEGNLATHVGPLFLQRLSVRGNDAYSASLMPFALIPRETSADPRLEPFPAQVS